MNKNMTRRAALFVVALVATLSTLAFNAVAQDGQMMSKDKMMMSDNHKPMVAIIRADWCSACQKIEPSMAELMEQYKDRINFVVLDVSTDEKVAESAATARRLGISKFFAANKKKTSTVAVFDKKKVTFRTDHNYDREAYVRAFDQALAKHSMMKKG